MQNNTQKPLDKSKLQRQSDRFVVWARELSSRGTSFFIAVLGVILQAAHTTLLLYDASGFKAEWQKIIVAAGMGILLSGALLVFTLKHKPGNKKSERTLNLFFYLEVFIGAAYYLNKFIFHYHETEKVWPGLDNWIKVIITLPFAFMAPYAIKQFAYVIESDTSLEFGKIDIEPDEAKASRDFIEKFEEFQKELDEKISVGVDLKFADLKFPDEIQNNIDVDKYLEDMKRYTEEFKGVRSDTKEILKKFKSDIEHIKDFNPSDYIKKGSKLKIRMPDGKSTEDVEIKEEDDDDNHTIKS